MRRKTIVKLVCAFLVVAVVAGLCVRYYVMRDFEFRASGSMFQINRDGEWQDFLVKGVNMGAGIPGAFPGEMATTKEQYVRWFKQISDMNVNTIRVYTILAPHFYEALFEYNLWASEPLYLFHGAWLDEEAMAEHNNAFAPELSEPFEDEIRNLVDLLHGKANIEPRTGHASGTYRWDVSPYVIGYILGIELDGAFVSNTNDMNPEVTGFDGEYLYTQNASPHECWLAEMGDLAIAYEMEKYKTQKPVSWSNWITTDPLTHSNEPMENEDLVSVDTEHILAKDTFTAGLFASYHIYPYYPELMMYQPEYANYVDDDGDINPYKGYLLDLRAHHTVPLLIAEFGIPASRGCTHENILTGYNQGYMSEKEQGEYVADMFDDIVDADCAGGLVFTWQDEWFKRSWNTMDYDIADRRAYWSNYQVSEQHYGILSFDPGENQSVVYADGDPTEWEDIEPISQSGNVSLSMASDEKFVYFLIRDGGMNVSQKQYVIGIDSVGEQGNLRFDALNVSFSNAVDTAIVISGRDDSRVMSDAYYDTWYRMYSLIEVLDRDTRFEQKNSGIFNPINLILRNQLTLPLTGESLPQSSYETGKLRYGNGNPQSAEYDSLADFSFSDDDGAVEIRVPWQLLNIADPSAKVAIGDLYAHEIFDINPVTIDGFGVELHPLDSTRGGEAGWFSWDAWDTPSYHERLKESYYILQDSFAKY